MGKLGFQAPARCRGLIRLASLLAPPKLRKPWLTRHIGDISGWWTLHERGELPGTTPSDLMARCWRAVGEAAATRIRPRELRSLLASPGIVPTVFVVVVLLTALWRAGFPETAAFLEACRNVHFSLPYPLVQPAHFAARGIVLSYALPAAFGLVAGLALIARGPKPRRGRNWRYWPFLALKLIGVLAVVPMVSLELAGAVRSWTPPSEGQRVLAALVVRLAFIASLAWALGWSVADQRQRCPVCLGRLSLPASIGSWGSVFEPPATELLCEAGHGSLCVPEADNGEPDRWIEFDSSWQELFEVKGR